MPSVKSAILKDTSDWHYANVVISRADNIMSFKLIVFEVALHSLLKNKERKKQTNKFSPLALLLISFHKFLSFRTLHVTCGFDTTKIAQYQSKACFRIAHFSERHAMPI